MLSNCALAAAASTSRLLCARRTFASLAPGNSDHHDESGPVLRPAPPSTASTELPLPNLDILNRSIHKIMKLVDKEDVLKRNQRVLLRAFGLASPTSDKHKNTSPRPTIIRELEEDQLQRIRDFFTAYTEAASPKARKAIPALSPDLRKALERAVTLAVHGGPKADEVPHPVTAVRRGRIKPTATPGRIKWEAAENPSPAVTSQLLERSRHDVPSVDGDILTEIEPVHEMRPIARLAHGLDRVLFNPGVNWLQDPRSRVFNYDPWLQKVPDVRDFAFERLPGFVKSSRDESLWDLCQREGRKFAGSTSSLSGLLSHIYFLLSRDRRVDMSTLSHHMDVFPDTFTPGQRMPAAVIMRHKNGVYATDSDSYLPGSAETNVLSWMGTMLEKFLTTDASTFARYMRESSDPAEPDTDTRREAYRYSMSPKMVMRSQLDAVDPRLPGSGVFDIKTRAAMSVRYDSKNWVENAGYLIRSLHGVTESFEREYGDLIRSAFLKYSFQARIGGMDGVVVAYHNTARVFGFQYIPLEEMDARLYGAPERGNRVFGKCVQVLEQLLETATSAFPGQSVRILAEKHELEGLLRLFVEPVTDEQADAQIKENERSEHEEAVQLGEGVPPDEIASRRVQKAKEAADAEEKVRGAPIKMFTVQLTHLLGGKPVTADAAINEVDKDWTLKVTIERPALENADIRKLRAAARRRQFRANMLPTGVSVTEMAERWNKEARINPASQGPVPAFDPSHWEKADWKTKQVRELSRKGAEETRRLDEIDKEMGHERLVPDWVQASGITLPEVKQQLVDLDYLDKPVIQTVDKELPGPPTPNAEDMEELSVTPPPESRARKTVSPKVEDSPASPTTPLEMFESLMSSEHFKPAGRGMEKVVERMHEIPLAPEGEAHTHAWDESDNLHRVDTEMDRGTRPSPTHESSIEEWKADEDRPLPGTKAAKDEEAA